MNTNSRSLSTTKCHTEGSGLREREFWAHISLGNKVQETHVSTYWPAGWPWMLKKPQSCGFMGCKTDYAPISLG